RVEAVEGYGIAELDEDMRIKRFVEKPPREEAPSNLANTGLYLFNPMIREVMRGEWVRKTIEAQKRLDFGYDFIPYLIGAGYKVYGYIVEEGWYDVGSPERYLEAMYDILRGRLKSLGEFDGRIFPDRRIWIQGETPGLLSDKNKDRDRLAEMIRAGKIEVEEPVLIGRHCQIEDGVRISNSCIDNYTRIEGGAVIEDSAIMDRAWIGGGAVVEESIIGRHVTVRSTRRRPTSIAQLSAVGDDVWIEEGSALIGAKVHPHLRLEEGVYRGVVFEARR
ncbi:MAG: sugar phosphate nucleotidyltransferase, partial [Candidatus Bathyarchaeia archaeon]